MELVVRLELHLSTGKLLSAVSDSGFSRCVQGFKYSGSGGYDRGECLKSVEEYDVVRGVWTQLQSMKDERGRFDSAVLNGKVGL